MADSCSIDSPYTGEIINKSQIAGSLDVAFENVKHLDPRGRGSCFHLGVSLRAAQEVTFNCGARYRRDLEERELSGGFAPGRAGPG